MNSMMMISNVFLLLTRSLASAHRISEVLDERYRAGLAGGRRWRRCPTAAWILKGSPSNTTADAQEYALSGVQLHIPAGQTVGILGGTGSAKTTLVQLIPRLYDATEGTVQVGGRDVREYDLRALRDAVGIVLQKNVLFSGTVRENLRWGNPDAERRDAVGGLPGGLRRRISGADAQGAGHRPGPGRRQRLRRAEAAAVHRPHPAQDSPKVLIFDDSTSAVDTATEGKDPHRSGRADRM